jgi:hypothetical protein
MHALRPFLGPPTSEIGTERTSGDVRYLVANGGKADIAGEALSVAIDPQQTLGESNGHDDHRYKSRRRELLNHVRLFFPNVSPGGSNSTAHLLGLFCCYTKLISQKFGLQLHHFVYVLGIH